MGGQGRNRKIEKEIIEKKKGEEVNRRDLNSFTGHSRNITNPEVVLASLCAMIPGGIVKA